MRAILLASTMLALGAVAAHAQAITPGSGTLTDAVGNVWTITASGSVKEDNQWTPGGGGTAALTIMDGTVYGEDAHGKGWFALSSDSQYWTSTTALSEASTNSAIPQAESASVASSSNSPATSCSTNSSGGTGTFHVSGGQIIGPDGEAFIARGINLYDSEMGDATAATNTFKGLNFIRVNIHSYDDPSTYDTFVSQMTSQGRVVEFEDHPDAGGGDQSGKPVFTGAQLAAESAWYASMAGHYRGNPYVWFGTYNEPPTKGGSLSQWQLATYNAIRNTGNNSPILLEISGWPGAWNNAMDPSVYARMTNTIWDTHFYGWVAGYSTDQSAVDSTLANEISGAQQIQSADGVMPALIGEYGDATDGDHVDANAVQTITAVINAGSSSKAGSAAWAWNPGGGADHLLDGGGQPSSPYGQMVELFVNTDVVPLTACQTNKAAQTAISSVEASLKSGQ